MENKFHIENLVSSIQNINGLTEELSKYVKLDDYNFNGTVSYNNIDACTKKGFYIIQYGEEGNNNTTVIPSLLINITSTNNYPIRQIWFKINTRTNEFTSQYRLYNNSAWGSWIIGKINGTNITNASIPNSKLSDASVTPAANKIPIANNNGMLCVRNGIKIPFTQISSNTSGAGWFRVCSFSYSTYGSSVLLHIMKGFHYTNTESYLFAITRSYNGVSITQLTGKYDEGQHYLTRIRILRKKENEHYVDVYNESARDGLCAYGIGHELEITTPTLSNDIPEGYDVVEFETTNGFKASEFSLDNLKDKSIPHTKLIEGSGSGLDADKLDGKDSDYYLQTTNMIATKLIDEDLDNIKTEFGTYYANVDNTCLNKPSDCNHFSLIVIKGSGPYIHQMLIDQHFNIWRRVYNGGYWYDWWLVSDANGRVNSIIIKTLTDEDLNDLTDSSYTIYQARQNTCKNLPSGVSSHFNLQILNGENQHCVAQVLTDIRNQQTYKRSWYANKWSDWKRMLTEGDKSQGITFIKLTNENLDKLTYNGFNVYYAIGDSTVTNTPSFGNQYFSLQVSGYGDVIQRLTYSVGSEYIRTYQNNTWSEWKKVF